MYIPVLSVHSSTLCTCMFLYSVYNLNFACIQQQLLLIQHLYSVPSRTQYFWQICRFPYWTLFIILCIHHISYFNKSENYTVCSTYAAFCHFVPRSTLSSRSSFTKSKEDVSLLLITNLADETSVVLCGVIRQLNKNIGSFNCMSSFFTFFTPS